MFCEHYYTSNIKYECTNTHFFLFYLAMQVVVVYGLQNKNREQTDKKVFE